MTQTPPSARTPARRIHRLLVIGLVVAVAALTATLGYRLLKPSAPSSLSTASPSNVLRGEDRGALGEAGGAVADGVKVFDHAVPAVAGGDGGEPR